MKKNLSILIVLLLILGIFARIFHDKSKEFGKYSRTNLLMDTVLDVKVYTRDSEKADRAMSLAFDRAQYLADSLFDYHNPGSEVAELNRNAGKHGQKVSPELLAVLKKSLELSKETDGAFDISTAQLNQLWNFTEEPFVAPPMDSIQKVLEFVDYKSVKISGDSVFVEKEGVMLDLGAVAKGYIADEMLKILRENDVEKALVNAGGEVSVYNQTDTKPWVVAIQHPRDPEEQMAVLRINQGAIATSGDYERYFFYETKRYHHILDARTGMPATGIISVSVLAHDAFTADMLSTAIFVSGIDKGMELLERQEEHEAFIVTNEGQIIMTKGFSEKLAYSLDEIEIR